MQLGLKISSKYSIILWCSIQSLGAIEKVPDFVSRGIHFGHYKCYCFFQSLTSKARERYIPENEHPATSAVKYLSLTEVQISIEHWVGKQILYSDLHPLQERFWWVSKQTWECFSFSKMCVPEHSTMRQYSGLVNSPSMTAWRQTMKKKSSKMHVATLESHACSWAVNHCMLMKCFFQIMLLVLQWELLVYIRINSSMQAILYWEVVDEREGTVEGAGQGDVLVSSVSLIFSFLW